MRRRAATSGELASRFHGPCFTIAAMTGRSHIACLRVYPLAIPLRKTFRHAAHERQTADPVVVAAELADGTVGYGETLPRAYVTGEDVETVLADLAEEFLDELVAFRPASFPQALEQIDSLPMTDETGRIMTAARAGVELALLDAYSRHFRRPITEAVGWLGVPGFGEPGSIGQVRYSGVLSASSPAQLRKSVRKMRWFGLRDFKLKVGFPDDRERIREVVRVLKLEHREGDTGENTPQGLLKRWWDTPTLRLDANGAWTLKQAVDLLHEISDLPVACIEQPLSRERYGELPGLKRSIAVPIMHDESLIMPSDAEELIEMGVADGFNIRISKNGGFLPALRLAHLARRHGAICQLGCMVGETSILSAAGRRFLENVGGVTFAEGSYGRFLIRGDVVSRRVQFGWGGRPQALNGLGWGIQVNEDRLRQFSEENNTELRL